MYHHVKGSRHVVLATVHGTGRQGRNNLGLTGLHRPICLSFQDFQRLFIVVTTWHSTACSSTGRLPSPSGSTRLGISCLKFWKLRAGQSRSLTDFNCPLHLSSSASVRLTEPPSHRRVFCQLRGATAGSGLRLCVKDEVL